MADTVDTGLLPRTYFKAPRVPFDFRGVAIAIIGYLVYWAGGLLISWILGKPDVPGAFLTAATSLFAPIPFLGQEIPRFLHQVFSVQAGLNLEDYSFWHFLIGGAWFFAVWSFFGQAIHRIVSLRIARDEGLTLLEAFKFSAKNWVTVLLAPLIIGVAIAFFYLCNFLAGVAISIPFVGQFLALILIPLTAISTLLILLIALGGIFGIPLIGAAAAWERNGSLDAISRTLSYIFARPLQFFWNYFLIFLFLGVILLIGNWFIWTQMTSVDLGVWDDHVSVAIDAPERQVREGSDFSDLSPEAQKYYDSLADKTGYPQGLSAPRARPFARSFKAVTDGELPWYKMLSVLTFWAAINLVWLAVFGYAVYWFLGASTSVYADLRADVDGTEEDEIYLEEEEEDFDAFTEAVDKSEPTPAGEAPEGSATGAPAPDGAEEPAATAENAKADDGPPPPPDKPADQDGASGEADSDKN